MAAAPFVAVACGESTRAHDAPAAGGTGGKPGGGAARGGSANASHGGSGNSAGHGAIGGEGGETIGEMGGTGGVSDGPCSTDWKDAVGLTFNVELKETDPEHRSTYRDYVFVLEATDDGVDLVAGSSGHAYRGALGMTEGAFTLTSRLRISDSGPTEPGSSSHNGLFLDQLSLCVTQKAGADSTLYGTGRLQVIADGDDYENRYESPFMLHGTLDETHPSWTRGEPVDPLNPRTVTLSEPLEAGATASVDDGTDAAMALLPVTAAGTVVGFDVPVVLPLGFSAALTSTSRDLAGNQLDDAGFVLETLEDPGIQAQDGFESELHAAFTREAWGAASANAPTLVGGAQALAGGTSVLIDAGTVVFFRLERPEGSSGHVRLLVRPLVDAADRDGSIVVRAGAPKEPGVVAAEIPIERLEGELGMAGASGAGNAGAAGGAGGAGSDCACDGVKELDLFVPGTSDEILVSIQTPFIELSASSVARAIVDELRVE